jgi:hypothetical protein
MYSCYPWYFMALEKLLPGWGSELMVDGGVFWIWLDVILARGWVPLGIFRKLIHSI